MPSPDTPGHRYEPSHRPDPVVGYVGDPAIASCALAYRSYIPSTKGANGRARVLLTEALENISETTSPATVAWIAARHAEESAQLGDKAQALASWRRAEDAFSISDPDEDRVWTRFLDQNRFDSYRIATYSKIGKLDEAQEIAAAVLAPTPRTLGVCVMPACIDPGVPFLFPSPVS